MRLSLLFFFVKMPSEVHWKIANIPKHFYVYSLKGSNIRHDFYVFCFNFLLCKHCKDEGPRRTPDGPGKLITAKLSIVFMDEACFVALPFLRRLLIFDAVLPTHSALMDEAHLWLHPWSGIHFLHKVCSPSHLPSLGPKLISSIHHVLPYSAATC